MFFQNMNNLPIEFLKIAQIELDETFVYYENIQNDLGYRFINEVKESISLIQNYPNAWHNLSTRTKRCLVKNFPYGVIYQIRQNRILIVAIANLHRKPNYWKNRI
ncbi:type II toxin-antitoxin system RelE/ParE family toxin [Arcobacter sp. YIC-464]|uniref:type II toxin-antitoxin system RelE/ParE family toxin n=1 Tax=Arcobacter sp. YIC-464 TaxID=3376631 RepID=UPI003C233835